MLQTPADLLHLWIALTKELLNFVCNMACFVLVNGSNRLLLHRMCNCKHNAYAMPAPTCGVLYLSLTLSPGLPASPAGPEGPGRP